MGEDIKPKSRLIIKKFKLDEDDFTLYLENQKITNCSKEKLLELLETESVTFAEKFFSDRKFGKFFYKIYNDYEIAKAAVKASYLLNNKTDDEIINLYINNVILILYFSHPSSDIYIKILFSKQRTSNDMIMARLKGRLKEFSDLNTILKASQTQELYFNTKNITFEDYFELFKMGLDIKYYTCYNKYTECLRYYELAEYIYNNISKEEKYFEKNIYRIVSLTNEQLKEEIKVVKGNKLHIRSRLRI